MSIYVRLKASKTLKNPIWVAKCTWSPQSDSHLVTHYQKSDHTKKPTAGIMGVLSSKIKLKDGNPTVTDLQSK